MFRSIWVLHRRKKNRFSVKYILLTLMLLGTFAFNSIAKADDEPLFLAVNINGIELGDVVTILRASNGDLLVSEQDVLSWRLNSANCERLWLEGKPYIRLDDLAGVNSQIDAGTQTLLLLAPATAFLANKLDCGTESAIGLSPTQVGGFLNYDLNWQRTNNQDSGGGLFEIGTFNSKGSGTATGVWRSSGPQREWTRLDTTWNIDMPKNMQSLRFGDAISRSSSWGRSVRFGGIQWATNFATQPNFVTFPLPSMRGEAVVPSTIDIYVNNSRRLQKNVEPGPFDLVNVPVVTGQGELQLVVNDLLGRQQIITQPYYASQRLLQPGLRDFSFEGGSLRENYGIDSASYGRFMLSGTDRLGLSADFTRELRAEVLNNQQTFGASGVWLMPKLGSAYLGTLNFGAAASHGPNNEGLLYSLGAERQARNFSYSVQSQYSERDFVQLGQLTGSRPRQTFTASLGMPLGSNSFGLNYLQQSTWEGDRNRLLSANLSRGLGSFGFLSINALRNYTGEPRNTVSIVLTIPLDASTSVSADITRQGDLERKTVQMQRNAPAGDGFGYRLRATDDDQYLAGGTLNTERASFTAETASTNGKDSYRAGASGGIAIAGGGAFLSRRINDSFAVVKVDNYPGVRVYRENQEVTRTDKYGRALVPNLRAYQKNLIGIEQSDLPLDAEIDELNLRLAPAIRSGVVVDFPVRHNRNVSFRLVNEKGIALVPGTLVQIEGDKREFPVGYDGRVFISGVNLINRLFSEWAGQRCSVELIIKDSAELLPDLGTLTCKGIPP